jgi:hypothetical protein
MDGGGTGVRDGIGAEDHNLGGRAVPSVEGARGRRQESSRGLRTFTHVPADRSMPGGTGPWTGRAGDGGGWGASETELAGRVMAHPPQRGAGGEGVHDNLGAVDDELKDNFHGDSDGGDPGGGGAGSDGHGWDGRKQKNSEKRGGRSNGGGARTFGIRHGPLADGALEDAWRRDVRGGRIEGVMVRPARIEGIGRMQR